VNPTHTALPRKPHNYVAESVSSPPELGGPLKIWDVGRLQELAAELPARWVPIAEIRDLDRVGWYGNEGHCGRLTVREVADHARRIAEADLGYPVLLSAEGYMLDGFHRLAKAYQEGRTQILAKQFPTDPEPDRTRPLPEWIRCAAERGSI
jgi:hypothetical protein